MTFTVQALPGQTFTGTVQQVRLQSTTVDNVVNYTVVVTLENPERQAAARNDRARRLPREVGGERPQGGQCGAALQAERRGARAARRRADARGRDDDGRLEPRRREPGAAPARCAPAETRAADPEAAASGTLYSLDPDGKLQVARVQHGHQRRRVDRGPGAGRDRGHEGHRRPRLDDDVGVRRHRRRTRWAAPSRAAPGGPRRRRLLGKPSGMNDDRHPDGQAHEDLRERHERGARPARRGPDRHAGRARGHHGRLGLRQVDADEPARLSRHADVGVVHAGWRAGRRTRQERARRDPQPEAGLRVPGLQPAGANERAQERRAAHAVRPQRPQAGHPRARRGGARARRARRAPRPSAERAVRRPAAAGGDRAGPRDGAGARPGRRADRQPRQPHDDRGHGALPGAERSRASRSSSSRTSPTSPSTRRASSRCATAGSCATSRSRAGTARPRTWRSATRRAA